MQRALRLGLLVLVPFGAAAQSGDLAITNVNLIDVERGRMVADQTVLIADGRITAVGRVRVPAGARTLDGRGKYLIPGLWDMHAHSTLSGRPRTIELPLFIANGVTGVREMVADCRVPRAGAVGCIETYRQWQREIEEGTLLGPRLLQLGSWTVNGPRGITDSMPKFFKAVTEEDGRELARYFKQRGVDFIKIYQDIPRAGYLGLAAEARKLGLGFAGHEPTALSPIEISNAGQLSIEHARVFLTDCFAGADSLHMGLLRLWPTVLRRRQIDEHDAGKCSQVFRTMKKNRTWYVPTHLTRKMDAFADDSVYRNDPRLKYVPALQRLRWTNDANGMVRSDTSRAGRQTFMDYYRKGLELTGAAFRAGVPIMLGTDAGDSFVFPGFAVHDELEELTRAGLTPAGALKTATYNGAVYLGRTADFGSVRKGRYADLVLLDANPLADIRNTRRIHAVIYNGNVLDRARLDALLAAVEAEAKR